MAKAAFPAVSIRFHASSSFFSSYAGVAFVWTLLSYILAGVLLPPSSTTCVLFQSDSYDYVLLQFLQFALFLLVAEAVFHIAKPHPQIARQLPIVLVATHQQFVLLATKPLIVCLDGNPPCCFSFHLNL